jgi:hypothetical protein
MKFAQHYLLELSCIKFPLLIRQIAAFSEDLKVVGEQPDRYLSFKERKCVSLVSKETYYIVKRDLL